MGELVTIREYARRRGVALNAIQYHIRSGTIILVNGRVDVEQADQSYGVIHRGTTRLQDTEAGQRSARSKVVLTLAKLRLAKQRHDTMADRYLDRAMAVELAEREAVLVLDALKAAPADYVETFATELCISVETGLAILDRFTNLALEEIGDLRHQAIRDAERA